MLLFVCCVTMENAMPQISRTALVPYSAEQMYQLVNDVQSACRIEFHLDFECTNKLIELAVARIFKELASNMVQAFTTRAKEVYSVA